MKKKAFKIGAKIIVGATVIGGGALLKRLYNRCNKYEKLLREYQGVVEEQQKIIIGAGLKPGQGLEHPES